ncbi:uracil-DNA glycosylase [Loktanella sp. 3ANDIMAR09]|uniref:uracil-DNA glycosylase n=1 Tax=Loktanella sp. 3ANDIMAR09 TaxID=1225657 RepID=UPI0006F4803C|nr:uracil-DNA glycosylase [Loktanella sp. 3ANDIMAR09]KQI68403.1 uracil-DNA glycosylase [Loktanella sp. 3ANDIMAR09]
MESVDTYWSDLALLDWQVELGAVDAVGDVPVDRYALEAKSPKRQPAPAPKGPPPVARVADLDPVALARDAAQAAADLPALAAAQQAFELCELKRGARNFVFADGHAGARVMIVGEAPGRLEDREGRPFVGEAGQLLDRMLAAIGLDRGATDPGRAVYITNVLPWRPPGNATPGADDVAMMVPFLERHIALANPDLIVLMGNTPCGALLGRQGITRLRGAWAEVLGRPALPMFHPAYLLRNTIAKREAWADLLALKSRLKDPA